MSDSLDTILGEIQELKTLIIKKEKPFLSAKESAAYLGVSLPVVYIYSHRRLLPKYKIGKRLFFKIADLDRFILNEDNQR